METVSRAKTGTAKKRRVTIAPEDEGLTVGRYLVGRCGFTKNQVKHMKYFRDGIQVNGTRVRVTHCLAADDLLEVRLEEEGLCSQQLEPAAGVLRILYEDEDLIAVWKEAGEVVHPSHGHYSDTVSNRLYRYFVDRGEAVKIRSIGRLDQDTSGILVFARHAVAAQRLWEQRRDGRFRKMYEAWCEGVFSEEERSGEWHTVDAPIAPMVGEKNKMCVSPEGKRAVTRYRVAEQRTDRARLQLQLETGRTHQIRVHMAWLNHPLIGDPIYGHGVEGSTHAQLCACRAELRQPLSGERIILKNQKAVAKSMAE